MFFSPSDINTFPSIISHWGEKHGKTKIRRVTRMDGNFKRSLREGNEEKIRGEKWDN